MKQFKDITLKNEEGNDRREANQKVFRVALTETAPQNAPTVIVEDYNLERIELLIANTEKDLAQIQARLEWAKKAKKAIESAIAEPEKKKDN